MIARLSYASQSADEAWDALSRMYTSARPHAGSPDARIAFDTLATPEVSVDRGCLHSAGGAFEPSPDQINVISVVGGRISLDFRRHGVVANEVGDSYLYLPEASASLEWDDFAALALRLPSDLVAATAEAMTGLPAEAFRFLSPRPVSDAHARLWRHSVESLWSELGRMQTDGFSGTAYRARLNLTIAAAVTAFPSTVMTRGYLPSPGDVAPAAVRRAVAFVDAHASLPLSVADIAEAAGTSPRALRAAFRRHLDTTPTGYLRRVRLEGARHDLRETDPSTTGAVDAAGYRWGFTSAERFRAAYRHQHGCDPGDTLPS